jgi:hypothetical protein
VSNRNHRRIEIQEIPTIIAQSTTAPVSAIMNEPHPSAVQFAVVPAVIKDKMFPMMSLSIFITNVQKLSIVMLGEIGNPIILIVR